MSWRLLIKVGVPVLILAGLVFFYDKFAPCDKVCQWQRDDDYFALGQYYFNHDDNPAGPYDLALARLNYEKAIAADPEQNNLLWYQLGRIDFLEGKFADALEKFTMQENLFGDQLPNVYYMTALTYGYQARRDNDAESWLLAEFYFKKFISYAPEAPWSRVDLAWVYFSQGKFLEMIPVLEEGLVHESDNPWLLNMYGLAVMNTSQDKTTAKPYFEQALAKANKLTEVDWGQTYPGNDPYFWNDGLEEFRSLIGKNLDLASNTQ